MSNNTVAENSAGAIIGTLSASDNDGDSLSYSLASGGDNDLFEISGTTLKLKSSTSLDYETQNALHITISVSDGSASTSLDKTIVITNIDESVVANYLDKGNVYMHTSLSPNSVVEPLMGGSSWSQFGKGVDLTYSFANAAYFRNDYDGDGTSLDYEVVDSDALFIPNSVFKDAIRESLKKFSDVSLLNFTEVSETSSQNGQLRIGEYKSSLSWENIFGSFTQNSHALPPYFDKSSKPWAAGDVFLAGYGSGVYGLSDKLEAYPFLKSTIAHEIGHALGFSHPHDTNLHPAITTPGL